MKIERTAIVLGGTGLVGRNLVRQLLDDDYFTTVKVLGRRKTGLDHPKLVEVLIDFKEPHLWKKDVIGDVLFSAFGTTLKKAGSKEVQYRIDYHYQFQVARMAAENSVPDYVLVSAPGASVNSKIFYSRMKGELDRDVAKLGFDRLIYIKPSILVGHRDETRLGERLGIVLGKALQWLPGFRKYRPISAETVARAMIYAAKNPANFPIVQYLSHQLFEMK